ncbi:sensory rhodopsin transducer [Terrabacter terrae]
MIGQKQWVIADGWIPPASSGPEPEMTSHESACMVNMNDAEADVEMVVYFTDREPVGPYRMRIPAQRVLHVRFNDFAEPEPIPLGTDYSVLITASVPIVVQHTRLDSRQAANALASTIAYPASTGH